jgi:4-hydroxy-tetrahydrodipicolinate reductase
MHDHSGDAFPDMNLAIIGYGKMGHLIEQLAPEYNFSVKLKLSGASNQNSEGLTKENLSGIDVAVEFSTPLAAVGNIERLAALGVSVAVGTTGWLHLLPHVQSVVHRSSAGLVWSPNYSIGIQMFFKIVSQAARLIAAETEYGAWAWEIHHAAKKDAPSGTLLALMEEMKRAGYERPIAVSATRAGAHPGTHEIGFDSLGDTITLRHTARSREAFARGALRAARWVVGKKGVFSFREIIHEL